MNTSIQPVAPNKNPWTVLLITLFAVMVGFQFIGSFFGLIVALPFFNGSIFEFAEALKEPEAFPGMRYPLLIMQGVGSTIGFIIVPWILLKFIWKSEPTFFPAGTVHPIAILLTFLLVPDNSGSSTLLVACETLAQSY